MSTKPESDARLAPATGLDGIKLKYPAGIQSSKSAGDSAGNPEPKPQLSSTRTNAHHVESIVHLSKTSPSPQVLDQMGQAYKSTTKMIETSGRKGKTTHHRTLRKITQYLARASMQVAQSTFVEGHHIWRRISRPRIVAVALQRCGLARQISRAWRMGGTALGIQQPTPVQRWRILQESSLECCSSWMWRMPPNVRAHRPRASNAWHATETQSRGSVQPVC